MKFKATGSNTDTVNALQNLATLVFINHKFLTAVKHPDWLYCSFEDDFRVIFNQLTTLFKYSKMEEKDVTDRYTYSSVHVAVLNYRERIGYYKHHKPFLLDHK